MITTSTTPVRNTSMSSSSLVSTEFDSYGFPNGMTEETRELAMTFQLSSSLTTSSSSSSSSTTTTMMDTNRNHDDADWWKSSSKIRMVDPADKLLWKRRIALSKTITLVESSNPIHHEQAALLLTYLLQKNQQQLKQQPESFFRIGIAGPPGAGKSTLIEALGKYVLQLNNNNNNKNNNDNDSPKETSNVEENPIPTTTSITEDGKKYNTSTQDDENIWKPGTLSVICIDPSSITTGGSLMGDKTRMMDLSRDFRAFVRPAPTKGTWGGIAPRTDDVIRIVAASGSYPLILLETVGLGQSELEVQQCVDLLILAVPPGGGDSLQGVKKGIVEIADMIIVTKADGNLLSTARSTAADYRGAMQFLNVVTEDEGNCYKTTPIVLVSSITGDGLEKLWQQISTFRKQCILNGQLLLKRKEQDKYWMWKNLRTLVQDQMKNDPRLNDLAKKVNEELDSGRIPPRVAATFLFENLGKK